MSNWQEEKEVLLEGLNSQDAQITAQLLENQKAALRETYSGVGTPTSNIATFQKVVMPLIRRVVPATIAPEIVGVQPMTSPVGIVNSLRVRYANEIKDTAAGATLLAANAEGSGVNVAYDKYSQIVSTEGALDEGWNTRNAITPADAKARAIMLALESDGGKEMNLEIVKKSIEAESRKLQAKWTIEADQDAKALHGVDIEQELVTALSDEIVREQDRQILGDLRTLAGATYAFDYANADGRFGTEKFSHLAVHLGQMASKIGIKTRRGAANFAVVSPDVAIALRHSANGVFVPASGDIQAKNTSFVGVLNGTIKVYVDIYADNTEAVLMGYKGSSALDSGYVFCPYVPLMQSGVVTDPTTYDPRISLMTRYATCAFDDATDSLGNGGDYYATSTLTNIAFGVK